MRTIKFRAWNNSKAVERMLGWEFLKQIHADEIFERKNLNVMQFTGLNDKNGKEIYELDWIQTENGSKFVMVWDEKQAAFKACGNDLKYKGAWVHPVDGVGKEWEVIGNIYSNPELISQK